MSNDKLSKETRVICTTCEGEPIDSNGTKGAAMTDATLSADEIAKRITDYLIGGGLFNPELADHEAVCELLVDCRDTIELLEKDAARYRWLKEVTLYVDERERVRVHEFEGPIAYGEFVDSAIDAAIRGKP